MTYYIKKKSSLDKTKDIYYVESVKGFAKWSDDFNKRKILNCILNKMFIMQNY